ncbi:ABC transporter substrate-binding protein [Candidatus Chloroploca asiatica]|uniref:ABC transporter substrate-binding protein n=2 Tax=Candidatus Chloroploca asiatica TaxID=1506545 RepID=A0A2H3L8E6_9CHLR|nr:ABC transporter substrate-binding protein [Candidatus Chloroploca asiatica]
MKKPILFSILLFVWLLSACQVEGGVDRRMTVAPTAMGTGELVAEATAAIEALVATAPPVVSAGSVRIGLAAEPADLLPYHIDSADERVSAPLTELLFPSPLLLMGYTYTNTGVLERVPSFENGDVAFTQVEVYLDSLGLISPTPTETITTVEQINVTFHWNPDLVWSDGTPLTAEDSLFAYELARQINLGQETNDKLALLERYELVDPYTTRAVLKPDFVDPAYLSTYFTPLPRHLLADQPLADFMKSEFALKPVGYGPFMVERREPGSVRLIRNPFYPEANESITGISVVFRDNVDLLRTSVAGGSLDVVALNQPPPELLAALRADAEAGLLTVDAVNSPIWEHLDFNLDVAALQDIRVRRAIAHAINRDAMNATLLGDYGRVLESWIVPEQWAAVPLDQLTRYPFNPDLARQLLDEVGIVDTDGDGLREVAGQPFILNLITTQGSPLRVATAEQIRDDLAAVGLGISVQELPTATLYSPEGQLFRRTFDLALFAWIAGPDPRGWERWSCAGVPNESNGWTGNNFSGWCFFEADRAIRMATTSLDRQERLAAYLKQQQLFTQEVPVLPLFQRVDLVLVNPTVLGIEADPTAPFTWNLMTWTRQ